MSDTAQHFETTRPLALYLVHPTWTWAASLPSSRPDLPPYQTSHHTLPASLPCPPPNQMIWPRGPTAHQPSLAQNTLHCCSVVLTLMIILVKMASDRFAQEDLKQTKQIARQCCFSLMDLQNFGTFLAAWVKKCNFHCEDGWFSSWKQSIPKLDQKLA